VKQGVGGGVSQPKASFLDSPYPFTPHPSFAHARSCHELIQNHGRSLLVCVALISPPQLLRTKRCAELTSNAVHYCDPVGAPSLVSRCGAYHSMDEVLSVFSLQPLLLTASAFLPTYESSWFVGVSPGLPPGPWHP